MALFQYLYFHNFQKLPNWQNNLFHKHWPSSVSQESGGCKLCLMICRSFLSTEVAKILGHFLAPYGPNLPIAIKTWQHPQSVLLSFVYIDLMHYL